MQAAIKFHSSITQKVSAVFPEKYQRAIVFHEQRDETWGLLLDRLAELVGKSCLKRLYGRVSTYKTMLCMDYNWWRFHYSE